MANVIFEYFYIHLLHKKFWEELFAYFDTQWITQKSTPPTIICCRMNVYTEPLPSNEWRGTLNRDVAFQQ
jgi:hypothetical protein